MATSFYKYAAADGSGSEEMILSTSPRPLHGVALDEMARDIIMTTDVTVEIQ